MKFYKDDVAYLAMLGAVALFAIVCVFRLGETYGRMSAKPATIIVQHEYPRGAEQ